MRHQRSSGISSTRMCALRSPPAVAIVDIMLMFPICRQDTFFKERSWLTQEFEALHEVCQPDVRARKPDVNLQATSH